MCILINILMRWGMIILLNLFLHTLLSLSGNLGCLTWQKKEQHYPVLQVHAGSFHVSIIHQTLTWTTGSWVRDHFYVCVYTQGLGTPTMSQTTFLTRKNSHKFFIVLRMGFEPRVFGSQVRCSTNWATPSPHVHVSHTTLPLSFI